MNQGWLCPRCFKVNAPWKSCCDCNDITIDKGPSTPIDNTGPSACKYDWPPIEQKLDIENGKLVCNFNPEDLY
jgi:hypothetical protein